MVLSMYLVFVWSPVWKGPDGESQVLTSDTPEGVAALRNRVAEVKARMGPSLTAGGQWGVKMNG